MLEINNFLGIAIVGAGLSLLLGWVKAKFGFTSFGSKLVIIGASIVLGGAYYFFVDDSMPTHPRIVLGDRAVFLRQYFKFIRTLKKRTQALL